MVLMNQYAEIKKQDDLLHTCIWKGQSSFLLEGFIAQHRNTYVSMQQCCIPIAQPAHSHWISTQTLVCRWPWLASIPTRDYGECGTTLKPQPPTFYHMTLLLKSGLPPPDALQPKSWHWKEIVLRSLMQLARSQALGNQVLNMEYPELTAEQKRELTNSRQISSLVSKEIQKIVTKQDEPDVEAYITGMVQAAVAKMQTNQPASASDSRSNKKVTL